MKLNDFRKKNSFTFKGLAKFIGVEGISCQSTVQRWCMGKRIPEKKFMEKIFKVTKGKVAPNDFYEI